MEIKIKEGGDLKLAAQEILKALGGRRHVRLEGPMGAGKTTLTAALCSELGVEDEVNSPTFSIINEYRDGKGSPVFHFDFYRIESEAEAADLGLDEYFDSPALCLMEWSGNVAAFLPDDSVTLQISVADDGTRIFSLKD